MRRARAWLGCSWRGSGASAPVSSGAGSRVHVYPSGALLLPRRYRDPMHFDDLRGSSRYARHRRGAHFGRRGSPSLLLVRRPVRDPVDPIGHRRNRARRAHHGARARHRGSSHHRLGDQSCRLCRGNGPLRASSLRGPLGSTIGRHGEQPRISTRRSAPARSSARARTTLARWHRVRRAAKNSGARTVTSPSVTCA